MKERQPEELPISLLSKSRAYTSLSEWNFCTYKEGLSSWASDVLGVRTQAASSRLKTASQPQQGRQRPSLSVPAREVFQLNFIK